MPWRRDDPLVEDDTQEIRIFTLIQVTTVSKIVLPGGLQNIFATAHVLGMPQ
jgi:hypothetical protein